MTRSSFGDLHRHLYHNLTVLRDIQRLILQARRRDNHVIVFRDERGIIWRLEQLSGTTNPETPSWTATN